MQIGSQEVQASCAPSTQWLHSFNSNTKVMICAHSSNKVISAKISSVYNLIGTLLHYIGKVSADKVKYRQLVIKEDEEGGLLKFYSGQKITVKGKAI